MVLCLFSLLYILLSIPLAYMYIHVSHIPGVQVDFVTEALLGMLPAVGGALLCVATDMVTEWCGYHQRDDRDIVVLAGGFVLTLLTVLGDIFLTLQLAEGSALDDAFEGSVVNFDRALARELYACLVPAYVLCVAVVPPLFETV